jgi:hypothetical protein
MGKITPLDEAVRAEIEAELKRAKARFGEDNIKVLAVEGSWGETMVDRQVLAALRKLNRTGPSFDDITDVAD